MSRTTSSFSTLEEFKNYSEAEGYHFFDPDTMEFHRSRIESDLIDGEYFITSEALTFPQELENNGETEDERGYTIRRACEDGTVDTVSEYNGFDDGQEARHALRELI